VNRKSQSSSQDKFWLCGGGESSQIFVEKVGTPSKIEAKVALPRSPERKNKQTNYRTLQKAKLHRFSSTNNASAAYKRNILLDVTHLNPPCRYFVIS
jgi:hypothetical protein